MLICGKTIILDYHAAYFLITKDQQPLINLMATSKIIIFPITPKIIKTALQATMKKAALSAPNEQKKDYPYGFRPQFRNES